MRVKNILGLTVLTAIAIPLATYAVVIPNPLSTQDFQELITRLINLVFTIGLALAPISIIIAGILFMTAQGEPGKIQIARDIIKWTFIGIIIIICSKAIVTLIRTKIGA